MKKLLKSKAFKHITNSFGKKIILITVLGLLIGFFASILVSNSGLNKLKEESLKGFQLRLESHTRDTYTQHLEQVIKSLNNQLSTIDQELGVLRSIAQTFFDVPEELSKLNKVLSESKNYKDSLQSNGRYMQNPSDDQSVVLAQGYLLNPDGSLKVETAKMIENTQFMDLLLPAFQANGIRKQQIYFTGNRSANIYRMTPWSDLGGNYDKNYPQHNSVPNWEAFYPGLFDNWQSSLNENTAVPINESTIIYMEPSQDGVTGELIVSVKTGIWNLNRSELVGTLSYDVSVNDIIQTVEKLKISENAFAFLAESNGNIFAMNKQGRKALGFETEQQGLSETSEDAFKRIHLKFNDSKYPEIQALTLPTGIETRIESLTLNNERYMVLMKPLKENIKWDPTKQFYNDQWVAGFMIPESDFYEPYLSTSEGINKSSKEIILKQITITLLLFAFISSVIFLIYDRLSINMNTLIQATEQLKRKNYDIHVKVDSDDEFGKLAQAYNGMISEIKSTVQLLTTQNDILKNEMKEKIIKDEQIAYMKQYDALTGLPNKQSIYLKLDEMIQRSLTESKLGAFVVIGIDDFKKINEGYGIEIGDDLLKQIAERLRTSSGADVIARITGDEFGIIFSHLNALDDLIPKLEHLRTLLNKKYSLHNKDFYITASFGISSFPIDSTQSKEIVKFASATLIHSKETSKDNYKFYDINIENNIKNKTEMMNELRHAIDRNELSVYYQPIINTVSGKLIGVEALSRWKNEKFGFIPPSLFIPLAEELQIITTIEKWVLEKSLIDLKTMKAHGIEGCYISVNLSAIDLQSEHFMDYLEQQVSKGDLMPGEIQLEITEGILINNYDSLIPKLSHLSKLGVKIALDDFGTGYSSLKYIKKLPIHTLKIDRSFVKDYPKFDDGSIAKIIINLSTTLGMSVIAEGVETTTQAQFLSDNECVFHQGYLYDKPLEFTHLLEKYGK